MLPRHCQILLRGTWLMIDSMLILKTRAAGETLSALRIIKDLQFSRFRGMTKRRSSVGCDQYPDTAGFQPETGT